MKARIPAEKQTAALRIEKRKNGKVVTLVTGLKAAQNDFPALLTQLKNGCGAGGTISGDQLEIQGAHLERIEKLLREIGYRVKAAGRK